jgi:hypothetical protein
MRAVTNFWAYLDGYSRLSGTIEHGLGRDRPERNLE